MTVFVASSRAAAVCLLAAVLLAAAPAPAQTTPDSEDQKVLYAIGLAVAQQLAQLALDADELKMVQAGISDSVLARAPQVELEEYGPKIQPFVQVRVAEATAKEKKASAAYVDQQATATGASRTESGIVISELAAGSGPSPSATDRVKVHYEGRLRDGKLFDSSRQRGTPAEFSLDQVVPCWTEAVQTMRVGGKSRIVCPAELAYGDDGRPGIPGGAALVFEVELLEIVSAEAPAG